MAKVITTNYFRELAVTKQVDLSGDVFAVALMQQYISTADTSALQSVSAWSEVSAYEVSADGYSAVNLDNTTVQVINGSVISWDGDNISWNGVTLSTYGYCIYRIDDGLVVGFVEFNDAPKEAINGTLTIQWNSNGIMNII